MRSFCKIKTFKAESIYNTNDEILSIKLPNNIESIYTESFFDNKIKMFINKNKNIKIIGNKEKLEFYKTLDELIEEGKTFREANQIINNYER